MCCEHAVGYRLACLSVGLAEVEDGSCVQLEADDPEYLYRKAFQVAKANEGRCCEGCNDGRADGIVLTSAREYDGVVEVAAVVRNDAQYGRMLASIGYRCHCDFSRFSVTVGRWVEI